MPAKINSNFGESMFPTPSGMEEGLTTPLPGISTPALNTPVTKNESVGTAWRGDGFTQATDNARPAHVESGFDASFGFENMDQSSGGGGATNAALDTPWTGNLWEKP